MQTETLDRIYLELSNYTDARNAREIEAAKVIDVLMRSIERMGETGIPPADIDQHRNWARETILSLKAKRY